MKGLIQQYGMPNLKRTFNSGSHYNRSTSGGGLADKGPADNRPGENRPADYRSDDNNEDHENLSLETIELRLTFPMIDLMQSSHPLLFSKMFLS